MYLNTLDKATPNIYDLINEVSVAEGIDPKLVHALVKTESNYNPKAQPPVDPITGKRASSAKGLMQLIDATAADMNVQDPFDPKQNLTGGIKYLKQQLKAANGNVPIALAMYNQGPAGDLNKAKDYVNKIKEAYNGESPFISQDSSNSYINNSIIGNTMEEKPYVNKLDSYLANLANTKPSVENTNSLNNINEIPTNNKILGMDPNEFSMLAGSLGYALAPDTPLGRMGAATSNIAKQRINREQALADLANAQAEKNAAENRSYIHDTNMALAKMGQDEKLLNKNFEEKRKLSDLEYQREVPIRERQLKLNDLQMQKLQEDLATPKLSHITNNDGTVTFFDEFGEIVKQTDSGIGPSSQKANDKFVNPETSSQIADTISARSFTNAGLTYDKDLGYSDSVTGESANKEEIYKIQKFNNSINADVINYMNAKQVYAPEAYDKIISAHAFNAAERALKSNNTEELKTIINQYPAFMRPQIQEMMKRLNAAQSSQMSSLEMLKSH